MKISIIIINKDDRGIADTLTELLKIKNPKPAEIIVVDASNGRLDDIKQEFSTISWYNFQSTNNKKRTIPEQRNYGIDKAQGNVIVFIDANCIPSTNWLLNLTSPIVNEGEKIVAGSFASTGTRTIHDDESNRRNDEKYLPECPTMNVAFKKDVYSVLGGFDKNFDYGSDVDFTWRASFAGFKIRYAPTAQITHDWGNQTDDLKRAYRYGRGRAKLYLKHPNNWRNLFPNEVAVIAYPLYILGLPFTFFFWPYPLLILIPILKNINNLPFKKVGYQLVYAIGIFRGLISV